jgi:thioredoxin reductase
LHEVVIIGGGPAGLTAGMYCRMRRMSVLVLDAGRLGGQLVSLYGDKPVHDWPGLPTVIASELAQYLVHHARELEVETAEEQKVHDLGRLEDGTFEVLAQHVVTREEKRYPAQSVILAIGAGAFEPRRLKVPGEDQLDERFLTYRMPDPQRVAGKRVVVVGGGDSGLESAQSAFRAGAAVAMIQTRGGFVGMERNADPVREMGIPCHFDTRVQSLEVERGELRAVHAASRTGGPLRIECDYLVVNIGSAVNLDTVKRWGVEVEGDRIRVDGLMRTSVAGLFACGDIVTYEGKYKLLLTASSEGAVAASSAYLHVRKPGRMTMGDLYG